MTNYGLPRACGRCGSSFQAHAPNARFCDPCRPLAMNELRKSWRETNVAKVRKYTADNAGAQRVLRREIRRRIRKAWGKSPQWDRSFVVSIEQFGMEWLSLNGFTDVHRFTEEWPFFPFDLKGTRSGVRYLISVTSKTYLHDGPRHKRLAEQLGAVHAVLFVKPNKSFCLFFETTGNMELALRDIQ